MIQPKAWIKAASVFCAIAFCSALSPLHAQSSIGFQIQPGFTNIDGLKYSNMGGRAALTFQHRFDDQWDIAFGPGYFTTAGRHRETTLGNGHDRTEITACTRLQFLDLQAESGFTIGNRFRISIGPYLAYLFHAANRHHFLFTDNGEKSETSYEENNTSLYRQLDYGFRTSVSYPILNGLDLRLTYHQGLRQLNVLDAFIDINQRTQALMLGVDWRFWDTMGIGSDK